MLNCNIIISSKSLNSINNFFYIVLNSTNLNFLTIKKVFKKKKKKKIVTILKSPHVNKKAQEQFENRFFYKQFSINTSQSFKYLVFLKKLKLESFPDIKIKIKFNFNDKNIKNLGIKTLDTNNYNLTFYNFINNNNSFNKFNNNIKKNSNILKNNTDKKLLNFLKLLELHGQLLKF